MAPFARAARAAAVLLATAPCRAQLADVIAAGLDAPTAAAYRSAVAGAAPEAEARLRPILAALPREAAGLYAAPAVRYALHQDLVRNHGWHLRGLDPAGEAWNSSSLADVAAFRKLPGAAQAVNAKMSFSRGLDAREIAAVAATLEFVVGAEARRQLSHTYAKLGLPMNSPVPAEKALLAVEVYVTGLLLQVDVEAVESKEVLLKKHSEIGEVYPLWPQMKVFVKAEFDRQLRGASADAVAFDQAVRAIWGIGSDFGSWQKDHICTDMTQSLAAIEDHGTGRVLLTDFYSAAVNDGKWQFQESEAYLRQLGALDESSPGNPRVIIPNWVNGRSNCVGSSDFHDVCCLSQCDAFLAQLERRLGAPAASPSDVEAAVAALSSPITAAGRDVGPVLRNRLQAIAAAHGGMVPTYGRLFAQWMHHAFPRECPYPHRSGTTKQVNIFEVQEAGLASEEDMKALASRRQRRSAPVHSMPWNTEEELFAEPPAAARPVALAAVHAAVLLAAFATMALGFARGAARQVRGAVAAKKSKATRRPEATRIDVGLEV